MSENKRENDELNEKVTYLKYPIVAKCCATGRTNQYSVSYNPIFVDPSKRVLSHNWKSRKIEYTGDLYNKINTMCNLYTFQDLRHILYMDCRTFHNPDKNEILEFIKFKKNTENVVYDKEQARCYMLADQIFLNTDKRKYDPAFAYTFRYYIPDDQWKYFYLSPVPVCVYDSICKEIHKTFGIYYTIITFALNSKSYPYMEVLISNVPRVQHYALCQYLSRDNSTMDYSRNKLIQNFNTGLILGANRSLDILNSTEYNYRPVNDVETYRQLVRPSDLNTIDDNVNIEYDNL